MNHLKTTLYLLTLALFISCSDDDNQLDDNPDINENDNTALLISDVNSTTLNFLKPADETIQSFNARYSGGSVYVTESKNYAVITHRNHNYTETFNLGGEINHGDHSHDIGETGLAAIAFESNQPTHFKSEHDYIATYNDGDATLSLFNESSIHNASSPVRNINTGSLAHHGAMVIFKNGSIAITDLGDGVVLPEKIKIINQLGDTLFDSSLSISTSGIHGSAGNDDTAIFGSNTGVLVVKNNGEQKIIDYPSNFEDDVWFGSLFATAEDNVFIGYTNSKGVYFINIQNEDITPVYETTDLFKCTMAHNGTLIVSLTKTGHVNITHVQTRAVVYEGNLNIPINTESEDHSSVVSHIDVSDDFIYVSIPSSKKIVQIALENFEIIKEFNLEITPYQFKILDYDLNH